MCNNCNHHSCTKLTDKTIHSCDHDNFPWKYKTYSTTEIMFKECPIYTLQACFQLIERMYQRINSLELDVERLKNLEVRK